MFKKQVIEYFADAYIEGRTPNPCIKCNQLFKFGYFLDKALELGFDGIATGHYARIRTEADGKYHLRASGNINKDQSYFLYGMNQIQLSHTVFPLENAEKNQVRAEAERIGLLNAQQKDSQDICFVKSGCYTAVVDGICAERGTARRHGNFVDVDGNVLGTHSGIERYTIGQRKGVGVSLGVGTPLYVIDKRPETAEVVMGADKLLFRQEMTVKNISFVYLTDDEAAAKPMRLTVKTRYNQKPVHVCVEYNAAEKRAGVVFDAPVRLITPGQTAVF